jgi:predicted AAA+ superfamily ATPase
MYFKRHAANGAGRIISQFPVILITGARQVGKTTLLRKTYPSSQYYSFDDYILLESAKSDSLGFIKNCRAPVIIDAIQYAPEIMRAIKIAVDENKSAGSFLLTGSQQFELMKNVSESLAGRAGIINLTGLSSREISGDPFAGPFLPDAGYLSLREAKREDPPVTPIKNIWERIHRGSMPALWEDRSRDWNDFYSSYIKTYVERDVRSLAQVGDQISFSQFLVSCAARAGQLLNLSDIAKDVGISVPTAKRWLSVLASSNIVFLLQPFHANITKRAVKTPKLYFHDTGLASYLCKWLSYETLQNGAMAGNIFENFVISEIHKSYRNAVIEPPLYFYRDSNGVEIDLVIEQNGTLYPIEIKKTSSPKAQDLRHLSAMKDSSSHKIASGSVICLYDKRISLNGNNIIPIEML